MARRSRSAGTSESASLVDLATGKPRPRLSSTEPTSDGNVYTVAFSADGRALAVGMERGQIIVMNASNGHALPSPKRVDDRITHLAFSPDSTILASTGNNQESAVRLWNVATCERLFTSFMRTPLGDRCDAWCVAFSPDGKTFAVGLESGEVRLWDLASGWRIATLTGLGGACDGSASTPMAGRWRWQVRWPVISCTSGIP